MHLEVDLFLRILGAEGVVVRQAEGEAEPVLFSVREAGLALASSAGQLGAIAGTGGGTFATTCLPTSDCGSWRASSEACVLARTR